MHTLLIQSHSRRQGGRSLLGCQPCDRNASGDVNDQSPQREPRQQEPHARRPGLSTTNHVELLQRIRSSESSMPFLGPHPTPNLTARPFQSVVFAPDSRAGPGAQAPKAAPAPASAPCRVRVPSGCFLASLASWSALHEQWPPFSLGINPTSCGFEGT